TGSAATGISSGAYSRHRLQVDAPEEEGSAYVATTDIHSTSGTESRQMLGEATGTRGLTADDATSSGNWIVREEITQAQMRAFHVRFLATPAPDAGLTAYGRLHERLSQIPTDVSGDARRAQAISWFIQD